MQSIYALSEELKELLPHVHEALVSRVHLPSLVIELLHLLDGEPEFLSYIHDGLVDDVDRPSVGWIRPRRIASQ